MSIDASCFEGRIQKADVISAPDFWDASESRIWVVSVDDTGKVTPHIRPVEGLAAVGCDPGNVRPHMSGEVELLAVVVRR